MQKSKIADLSVGEKLRLKKQEQPCFIRPWDKWGPYVSERSWGSVREDYSTNGDAWRFFPFNQAHLRAYRWGEDGIAGFCDRYQMLVFAPAFWNGRDAILKERLFGLSQIEGNHGEDVKEIYYHLDALPSHAYLKYLYKYPQAAFPYEKLIEENSKRGVEESEYELIDTGIFSENRYFDIFIEYAKIDEEDWVVRIEAINRSAEKAPLSILPQLWFRNSWSWGDHPLPRPEIHCLENSKSGICLEVDSSALPSPVPYLKYSLGKRYLYAPPRAELLFTENESNSEALWNVPNKSNYVKDAAHRAVVQKAKNAVNPKLTGSKAVLHYFFPAVEGGKSVVVSLRLSSKKRKSPLSEVDEWVKKRKKEADDFYTSIHPPETTAEEKMIQRQAFSGMIWNKQYYYYDISQWLKGDNLENPPPPERKKGRNYRWGHIFGMRIFSMPDKWEFPWFASWDLTFHCLVLAQIDISFAKEQLWLLLFDQFQHPNGAIPACEWEFGNANPPIQAWAVLKIFEKDQDYEFLERCFHRLLLNFSWWINYVDHCGRNVFEGGFLGLDNITFVDRSNPPPNVHFDPVDGAAWISFFCLNLMRMSLYLAKKNRTYEGLAVKFFYHFLYVTAAMRKGHGRSYDLWDEKDAFFYGAVQKDGEVIRVPIRSVAGMIPFFAFDIWDENELRLYPDFYLYYKIILIKRPDLVRDCIQQVSIPGCTKHFFSLLSEKELGRMAKVLWDPSEFRSDYGLRSLSKAHERPLSCAGLNLGYEPGEAREKIMGGNSNWRGPIWMPMNYLLVSSLSKLGDLFQDRVQVEIEGEEKINLKEMSRLYKEKVIALFKRGKSGMRPIFGEQELLQNDPFFRDLLIFPEFFHGESGKGLGASHQSGWTSLIANFISEN